MRPALLTAAGDKLCVEDSHQRPLGTFLPVTVPCCQLQVPEGGRRDSKILRPKKLLFLGECALESYRREGSGRLPLSHQTLP